MECPSNNSFAILLQTQNHFEAVEALLRARNVNDPYSLFTIHDASVLNRTLMETNPEKLFAHLPAATSTSSVRFMCSPLNLEGNALSIRQQMENILRVILIFLTVITNTLVVIVLTRPKMHTPSNWLLVSIALADLFTGIFPLVVYISSLSQGVLHQDMTVFKHYLVTYLEIHMSTMFHTAAIFFNVLLAVQRLVYVCYPVRAVTFPLCRTNSLKYIIGFFSFCSLIFTIPYMVTQQYKYGLQICTDKYTVGKNEQNIFNLDTLISSVILIYKCTIIENQSFITLTILRTTFVNIIPSILLIWITIQLTIALRKFHRNRRQLLTNHANYAQSMETSAGGVGETKIMGSNFTRRRSLPREKESTSTMMLVVLAIFLGVEFPITFFICFYLVRLKLGPLVWVKDAMSICNLLVLLSYPINFFVFFAMSRPFRTTFKHTFPALWNIFKRFQRKTNA